MSIHKPVLLKETIELLNLKKDSVVVDATLGGGGHSREIREKIGKEGILISIDADIEAIKNFAKIPNSQFQIPIFKIKNTVLVNDNFSNLNRILESLKIERVDAVLADLGWSSDQLEGRGMSFSHDEPLDMRLDRNQELTAQKVVNEYTQENLEQIIRDYGEDKYAKSIARKIVSARKNQDIKTTAELAKIIEDTVPKYKQFKINPATLTFQAIRIEVNHELENLKIFIPEAIGALKPGGRLAVVSFHSLEDRIVKQVMRQNAGGCICPPDFPRCVCGKSPVIKIITKKPIAPNSEEIKSNPRARSAKMRVCEKL